ncbi:MAG: hypothetical protein ABWY35_09945 [Pseudorhodoplanes sp.]
MNSNGRVALLLAMALTAVALQAASAQDAARPPLAGVALEKAMTDYKKKMRECTAAREKHEALAVPYWERIDAKRKGRAAKRRSGEAFQLTDYVLEQPPVYAGPACPPDPSVRQEDQPDDRPDLPVAADFLRNAREHFGFVPDAPKTELDYKRAYVAVAAAAGLTKEQVVRIYSFESGGTGKYDVQAGLEKQKPGAKALSTAFGYNQLLTANTASLLAEKGDRFVKTLNARAAQLSGEDRKKLERKIEVLKRMVAHARTVPVQWSEHVKLGRTPKGLALHALILDIEIGPLLQTQKLLDSVVFAKARGIDRPLTAAELEMMNLTGDGNGFDMVSMPQAMRPQVPTSNFFQRRGYERNPIAGRSKTVENLIAQTDAVMDRESKLQGAKDMMGIFP